MNNQQKLDLYIEGYYLSFFNPEDKVEIEKYFRLKRDARKFERIVARRSKEYAHIVKCECIVVKNGNRLPVNDISATYYRK